MRTVIRGYSRDKNHNLNLIGHSAYCNLAASELIDYFAI
jgi:hypothetical protein